MVDTGPDPDQCLPSLSWILLQPSGRTSVPPCHAAGHTSTLLWWTLRSSCAGATWNTRILECS